MRLTRNNITRFSKNPVNMDIPRTKFSMNSKHLTTFNSGKLIPFFFQECLPGDTFVMDTNFMLRMSTPVYPVADTAYFDYYYFFVPNRLVWSNWREFMGENPNGAWTTNKVTRRVPQMFSPCVSHSNSDYLGLPLSSDPYNRTCLPHRALRLIWNDWFRSTALQDPLLVNMGDTEPEYEVGPTNEDLLPVCRFPDFFSTCLPAPQYGEAVQIGLIDDLPISFGDKHDQYGSFVSLVEYDTGYSPNPDSYLSTKLVDDVGGDLTKQPVGMYTDGVGDLSNGMGYDRLLSIDNAYLKANNAVFTSVNDLRLAFQVQKYQEALARGGSRYVEIIQSLFNVQSPDARLQRPEYIGGGRQIVDMTQVVQTSATDPNSTPQGNVSGLSKTMSSKHDFSYSCLEHGMIIGVCCVRPVHSYQQGLERYWFKRDTLDFYVPTLANIGEQPVYVKELYYNPLDESPDDVFGYQEAWADYRYRRSYVSGDMRSNAPNGSLDAWHYADYYGIKPTLSDAWIEESPALIDRTLAVESNLADQFICDIYFNLSGVRPLPAYSIPGLIDHH